MKAKLTPEELKKRTFKKEVKFKDGNNKIAYLDVEVTDRNRYPEFTVSGHYEGGGGQVQDHIKPETEPQKQLMKFWATKHLKSVTDKQIEKIKIICDTINNEEKERQGSSSVSDLLEGWGDTEKENKELRTKLEEEGFSEPDKVIALCLEESVSLSDLTLIIEESRGNIYSYGGREYLICNDEEADTAWDEDLENYLDDCVLPELAENARMYFDRDRWKEDAKIDGRGHSLNRYNGDEAEQTVNGTTYYLYRQ